MSNVIFEKNSMAGPTAIQGGAIYNLLGRLRVFSSKFLTNSVTVVGPGTSGGSAIYNFASGTLSFGSGNVFFGNWALPDYLAPPVSGVSSTLPPMTRTVTSADPLAAGSLRDVVYTSAIGSTILFALPSGVSTTVSLAENLYIGSDLTIDGGNQGVTISGGRTTRLFFIVGDSFNPVNKGAVKLTNLTLANGYAKGGTGGSSPGGPGGGGDGTGRSHLFGRRHSHSYERDYHEQQGNRRGPAVPTPAMLPTTSRNRILILTAARVGVSRPTAGPALLAAPEPLDWLLTCCLRASP